MFKMIETRARDALGIATLALFVVFGGVLVAVALVKIAIFGLVSEEGPDL